MDLVKAMAIFVKVVDAGSIAGAAASCELTPTMLGNHLRALEQRLGAELIHRTTRRQSVTDFGKAYYLRCQEILGLVDEADSLAFEAQTVCKGQLRITAPTIWANYLLIPAVAEYLERYPEVDLEVVVSDQVIDLIEQGLDAAVRLGSPTEQNLVARPLIPYRHTLCAAPGYLAKHGTPHTPDELATCSAINFGYSPDSQWWTPRPSWQLLGPDGVVTVETSARIKVDSAYAMHTAVVAGMGIAMLPEIMVAADIASGRLVPVLPDFSFVSKPVNLLYRADRRMPLKLRTFVDFMTQRFGVTGQL